MAIPVQFVEPMLTAAEEIDLALRIEAGLLAAEALARGQRPHRATAAELTALVERGTAARRRFVEANLRLVAMVARQAAVRAGLADADLFQEGCLGLMTAVDRFDCRRGCRFVTYAVPWVKAFTGTASARLLGSANVPGSRAEQIRHARGVASGLAQSLGRDATEAEVAAALGRSEAWTTRLLRYEHPVDLAAVGDIRVDDPDLEHVLSGADLATDLLLAVDGLERRVLELRMGFDGQPSGYAEAARALGITANRVRRVERRALDRLRRVCPHAARDWLAS
ncbi:MAG: sigma-70 family RNA polymerase sigma factor [Microlunatus sp.]|nr:sigma-70 family RNA polymerase sigma factor [Microlunatus sp.]MDN5803096.1 sigma-70 family RNA polymerase sigma factor [Microlunatus sp.]